MSAAVATIDAPFSLTAQLHGGGIIETLSAHFSIRGDALVVANCLIRDGWEVTVRDWHTDQRISGRKEGGQLVWNARYGEVTP